MKIFRLKDLWVVLSLAAVLMVLFIKISYERNEYSKVLVVLVNGEVIMEVDKPGKYPIVFNGKRLTTLIYDGKRAKVIDSNCPLKICEKIGWIEPGGEIICVPNRLVVKFKERTVDAATW